MSCSICWRRALDGCSSVLPAGGGIERNKSQMKMEKRRFAFLDRVIKRSISFQEHCLSRHFCFFALSFPVDEDEKLGREDFFAVSSSKTPITLKKHQINVDLTDLYWPEARNIGRAPQPITSFDFRSFLPSRSSSICQEIRSSRNTSSALTNESSREEGEVQFSVIEGAQDTFFPLLRSDVEEIFSRLSLFLSPFRFSFLPLFFPSHSPSLD